MRETCGGVAIDFIYDADGRPFAMKYNGAYYYYILNLQGDVIRLVNASGATVASYEYDPYGKVISATGSMAAINPLRYRSYYYDSETGMYFLQSRYYDPAICRFINADGYASTGQGIIGHNMFAYCGNNPVMRFDPSGHAPEWWQWAVSGAMVVAGIAMVATGVGGVAGGTLICAGANSIIGSYVSEATGGSADAGWVGGMITGTACGMGAGFAGNMLVQATEAVGTACFTNLVKGGMIAFGSGALGSATGQIVAATIDGTQVNTNEIVRSSVATGVINCLSGTGAGIGKALSELPAIGTTATVLANSLNAGWSLIVETVCDSFGTVASLLP